MDPGCCEMDHPGSFRPQPSNPGPARLLGPERGKSTSPGRPGGPRRVPRIARTDRFASKRPLGISGAPILSARLANLKIAPRATVIVGASSKSSGDPSKPPFWADHLGPSRPGPAPAGPAPARPGSRPEPGARTPSAGGPKMPRTTFYYVAHRSNRSKSTYCYPIFSQF